MCLLDYILLCFRIDLNLELIDKEHISKVKVAKILNIIGKRLELRYYDDEEQGKNLFSTHTYSTLSHTRVTSGGIRFLSCSVKLKLSIKLVLSAFVIHQLHPINCSTVLNLIKCKVCGPLNIKVMFARVEHSARFSHMHIHCELNSVI